MSAVAIVARKELRTYFQSAVALIFLGIFLLATLFSFFGYSSFFARNIADVRPLFQWLPLLLIFLVAAITMRQWAEERKMGTLEILLTLPVATRDLVIGKFLAGVALVAIALAMTLPIPVMVSMLGDLDWGPVIGGYVGALLVGSTYLALGLCVSSRTDNQVVSLMVTLVIGALIYLIGTSQITQFFGEGTAEILRALGTGSRFESIERGVLDVRDLVYYMGLAVFLLTLNWYFLESERVDEAGELGRTQIAKLRMLTGLILLNVIALNLWLAPVAAARIDMTERGDYSISEVTRETLAALDEPLRMSGYFSDRTHPLLAPLVPQIRDLLEEYAIAGRGQVQIDFADPNSDESLEGEIAERYGIRSVPFRVADRHQQAVVNSFFHVLIRYGDQFETLSFDELIEVQLGGEGDVEVRLKNLEYDLTRTIKRVSQDFQNMEALFARLPEAAKLTIYSTPDTLPEELAGVPAQTESLARELAGIANGKLEIAQVDPSKDRALAEQLANDYGVRPLALDLFGRHTFYLDIVLEAGGKVQLVSPRSGLSEGDLRKALEAAVRRATPGQLKTIGIYTETPIAPPPNPQLPPQFQPPPPQPDYRGLAQLLDADYSVETVDLSSGQVPDVIDVLILGKTGALGGKEQFAIDQYLMRGGKLLVLAGRYGIDATRGLTASPQGGPIFDMLERWGVSVTEALVMDPQNAPFPMPVQEQRGGFRIQRIRMLPYPLFPDIREDGFENGHPALSGVQNVTTPWSSPIEVAAPEGVEAETLLSSSSGTWLDTSGSIEPSLSGAGFTPSGDQSSRTLAVSLTGKFASTFADRPSPLFAGADADAAGADRTGRTIKESLADARLTVIGSAEIVSDLMLQLAGQPGGEVHRGDMQFVQNLIDWSVEDTGLLSIRSTGAFARTLRPMVEGEAQRWEYGSYAVCGALLALFTVVPRQRSRRIVPIRIPEVASAPAADLEGSA